MIKKIILIIILLPFNCYAETIVLNSGQTIEGKIIKKTNEYIKVEISNIRLTYYLGEIKSINGESLWEIPDDIPVEQKIKKMSEDIVRVIPSDKNIDKIMKIKKNEENALSNMRRIKVACYGYFSDTPFLHSETMFPKTLKELCNTLVPEGNEVFLTDKRFDDSHGHPQIDGYEFKYTLIGKDDFILTAQPIIPDETGRRYFIIHHSKANKIIEDLNKNGKLEANEPEL